MKPSHGPCALPTLLLSAIACSCSKAPDPPRFGDPGNAPARAVRVALVETQPMERVVSATGSLLAQEQATLSVKVPGRLHTVAVDLGSVVKQGDLLAQVDPKDYELRVRQASAALAQARAALGLPLDGASDTVEIEKTSLVKEAQAVLDEATRKRERLVELIKTGIASQSELDTAIALHLVALNKHQAALEEASTRLAALAQRRAELAIAEKQFEDTALRAPFDGAIQQRVAGLGEFLPAGALIVFAGIEKVVLARDGKASERTVVTGRRAPGWVEIVSGLKPGELVVVDPGNLRTGQPVVAMDAPGSQTSKSVEASGP